MSSRVYLFLTLVLYAVGAAQVLLNAASRRRLWPGWVAGTTLAGFVLHTAALSQRWTEAGRFPAIGMHDGTAFLAWTSVLALIVAHRRARADAVGVFVYPLAFVLMLASNLSSPVQSNDPVLRSLFLPIHTTFAFLGYGALVIAFAMGVLYLIQERGLRSRTPNRFYYLAPSLERCDTVGARTAVVGFVFLTLTITTGLLWSHVARGRAWSGDPKEWTALVAWALYLAVLWARGWSGWGGRRAAVLTILGFLTVVLVFVFASLGGAR